MNPLLVTLTFLTLMSILTSSELVHYKQTALGRHLFDNHQIAKQTQEELIQTALFNDFREEQNENPKPRDPNPKQEETPKPPKNPSLNVNALRPPNNSRLNFYLVLNEEKGTFLYETAAQLMRLLYGDTQFFQTVPNPEYQILDRLKERAEACSEFVYPDELATLSLGHPELQMIFYQMLKGEHAPSLLRFITFDTKLTREQGKINLCFAPEEILTAIFPNERIYQRIKQLREKLWYQIFFEETEHARTPLKAEFTAAFEQILNDYQLDTKLYKGYFDFGLSKPGNILLIEEPVTGIVHREKYHPRTRRRTS